MEPSVTSRAYFRSLQILHLALIAGQVIFLLITLLLVTTSGPLSTFPEETRRLFTGIAAGLALAGLAGSWLLFKSRLRSLQNKATLQEKCNGYRAALLIRYALLEAPALFTLVVFLLTGDYIFMGIALLLVIACAFARPAPAAMVEHLQLPYEEKIQVEDPAALL